MRKPRAVQRQLGLSLLKQGALDRAMQELRLTLRFNPYDNQANEALSSVLLRRDHHLD
ncbi:MAG: hypothetical protein WBO24_09345 [Nitrospirales bacterium]